MTRWQSRHSRSTHSPVWRETLFPSENGRYAFDSPGLPFAEEDGVEPEGFDRGLYAARFQGVVDTAPFNADIQFLIARGPDRNPIVAPTLVPSLIPVYYGSRTYGAGLRAVANEDKLGHFLSTAHAQSRGRLQGPLQL